VQAPLVPDVPTRTVSVRTRWSDEDNQGVLNNAVYLTLLEEARHAYFGDLGLLGDNRFPFLLAQTQLRFVAPGVGGVDATVEVTTTRLGTSSFEQAYRVRGPEGADHPGGPVWCEAVALLVCYDPATGASRPMDDAFRAAVEGLEGATG
jgi:acyl-CoA thioesterase FadM